MKCYLIPTTFHNRGFIFYCVYRWDGVPPECTLSGSVVAADAKDRLEPDWALLKLSATKKRKKASMVRDFILAHLQTRTESNETDKSNLRVEEHFVPESLYDSSRWTDFGLGFLGFDLGFPSPCSSNICCCFFLKYSCLMSSLRAFSSSFLIRSSSALRLKGKYGFQRACLHVQFMRFR